MHCVPNIIRRECVDHRLMLPAQKRCFDSVSTSNAHLYHLMGIGVCWMINIQLSLQYRMRVVIGALLRTRLLYSALETL
jgi:hypothetical protein